MNENYKDVMNFSQYLKTITDKIGIEELNDMVEKGYLNKLIELINDGLMKMSFRERPFHYIVSNKNAIREQNNVDTNDNYILLREKNVWNMEKDGEEYITNSCLEMAEKTIKSIFHSKIREMDQNKFIDLYNQMGEYYTTNLRDHLFFQLRCNNMSLKDDIDSDIRIEM
jgi:hypothetical protein